MSHASDGSSWRHILQYSFLKVFVDDEMIDAGEWAVLKKLALADGVVDENERMVLARIFDRVDPKSLDPKVRAEIESFRAEHGI
ncbi:MAG: hypothetical protein WC213_01995 [Arenimonas sp.]|jgi:hypothetical protein